MHATACGNQRAALWSRVPPSILVYALGIELQAFT